MAFNADFKKLLADPEKQKIALDFLRVFGVRLFQLILALATSYVLVRALSKEQFGEYHYILGWIGLLSIFALPGLTDSVMQAVSRGFNGSYRIGSQYAFLSSLLGSVGLAGFAGKFFWLGDQEMGYGFLIAALLFPFHHGMMIWKSYYQGHAQFKKLMKLEGFNSLLMSVLVVSFALLLPGYIAVPLIVIMAVPAAQNLIQSYKTHKAIAADEPVEDGNLKFGLKTTVYSILSVMANHIDKILLFNFLSPIDLAIFMAAQKLTEPVQNVMQDLAGVLAPKFAKLTHLSDNMDRAFFIIGGIFGAAITVFSFTLLPPVLIFIFGEPYSDAVPYCQALMLSVIFGSVASLRFRFIRSRMSLGSVRAVTLGNSIIRIAASSALIPFFGIVGAVVAIFITRIALAIQVHFDIQKFRKQDA